MPRRDDREIATADLLKDSGEANCTFTNLLVCRGPHIKALMNRSGHDKSCVPDGAGQCFIASRITTSTRGEQHNSARLAEGNENHGQNVSASWYRGLTPPRMAQPAFINTP